MKQNIQELIKQLVEDTKEVMSNNNTVSSNLKDYLDRMFNEFDKISQQNSPNQQEKMITLWIGGIIFALDVDDQKYSYSPPLYPRKAIIYKPWRQLVDEVKPQQRNHPIDLMYLIGQNALTHLPYSFCGELFKAQTTLVNSQHPTTLFPKLYEHKNNVDLLVKFCIENKNNLEVAEVHTTNTPNYSIPIKWVNQFIARHKASCDGCFNQTNLPDYDTLSIQDIFKHAQKTTFFGFKNKTAQILDDMMLEEVKQQGVLSDESSLLNPMLLLNNKR